MYFTRSNFGGASRLLVSIGSSVYAILAEDVSKGTHGVGCNVISVLNLSAKLEKKRKNLEQVTKLAVFFDSSVSYLLENEFARSQINLLDDLSFNKTTADEIDSNLAIKGGLFDNVLITPPEFKGVAYPFEIPKGKVNDVLYKGTDDFLKTYDYYIKNSEEPNFSTNGNYPKYDECSENEPELSIEIDDMLSVAFRSAWSSKNHLFLCRAHH